MKIIDAIALIWNLPVGLCLSFIYKQPLKQILLKGVKFNSSYRGIFYDREAFHAYTLTMIMGSVVIIVTSPALIGAASKGG